MKDKALLALVALGLLLALQPVSSAHAEGCSVSQQLIGGCTPNVSGNLNDGSAVLEGTAGSPGSGAGGSGAGDDGAASTPIDPNAQCVIVVAGRCLYAADHGVQVQPITLADIAAFRPDPGVDNMEPNGWMIVGLDTNFFATDGTQIKDGTLLGQPASVRFTPVTWRWTYGDGAAASLGTAGGTWGSQGIEEFDPSPTSHVYRAPGTYYIDLSIDFTAEYRFGGTQWIDIAGILPVAANRLVATAGDAKTVLVERECTKNPGGPGC
ncbi:MAG: uncharacterized protein JWP19_1774 [Rhodoglobus sp.]|nr:uncharacterized protein [Rhodoglobus sp.]